MTNRSRYFATRQMGKTGVKANRPEQLLAYELIMQYGMGIESLETEYSLKRKIKVVDHIDLRYPRSPTLDIAIFLKNKKIGIRVNGHYHDSRTRKDRIQKLVLEHPLNGWKIIDFWYFAMPNLFNKNPKIELAYEEVRRELEGVIRLEKPKKINLDIVESMKKDQK